jgi:diguanylate cyclase (GGDEF)-like protein/PAS domain S-box-containing protein
VVTAGTRALAPAAIGPPLGARRRRRELPFAVVLLGATFLALACAGTIATLRAAADASRHASTLVANLEASVHEQTALELGAVAGGGLTAAAAAALDASRQRTVDIIESLGVDERASFGLPALRIALDRYRAALDEQVSTLAAGDIDGATVHEAAAVAPAREAFQRIRLAAEARLEAAAADSATAADVGTLSALLSAAILFSLLFRRWERQQRKSAFLFGQQHGLRESEQRFRGLVQHSSDLITILGRDGVLAYVSPSAGRLLEVTSAALAGTPAINLVHPDDRARLDELLNSSPQELAGRTVEWRLRTGDIRHLRQRWRTFESTISTVDPTDPTSGIILNSRDVTDRVALEESLRHQAGHDKLTGLLNRAVLDEALGRALARASRAGRQVALLFIDLDGFKQVNDTLGHVAGDAVLVEVGARIRRGVRADAVVARLGGDEFGVLIEDLESPEQAFGVADRLRDAISRPISIAGTERRVGASTGIAFSSPELDDAAELVAAADEAMYQAKRAGGNQYAQHTLPAGGPAAAAGPAAA